MKGRCCIFILLLALHALLFSQYKPWYSHYNFVYGTKAMSMGNAFTAVADDLTAVFWNPAGLAAKRSPEFLFAYQSEQQLQEYDEQEKFLVGGSVNYNYDLNSKLQQIDFFSVSAPVEFWKMKWGFALSYYRYIPYGFKGAAVDTLALTPAHLSPVSATVTFKGSEGIDVLAFSASAALNEYAALGCTLQQFFGSGSLHWQIQGPGGEFHRQYTESLRGQNVIVGILFRPLRTLQLGFTYHSGLKNDFDSALLAWEVDGNGDKVNQDAQSTLALLQLPAQYTLGASWQPARWLALSCDYSTIDWRQGTLENYYAPGSILPYPQKTDFASEQQPIRNLRLGMELTLPLRRVLLHLRGGWSADRQLAADRSGQPLKITSYAAGVGCEFSQVLLLEIAYQRQNADWLEDGFFVADQPVASRYRADLLKFSLTYRFGRIFKE